MAANWKAARWISLAPKVVVPLVFGAAGCTGLSFNQHPTLGGELRREMVAETDLWMEETHPTTGDMELSYERPSQGDLWMSAEDAGIPVADDEPDERELPSGLERFLDLMVTPSPGPRP